MIRCQKVVIGGSNMKYERSCGAVVFTRIDGEIKYVLVKQLEGFYSFPKGHMEEGETEKETALREIFEEIGIRPNIIEGFITKDEHTIPNKPNVIKQVVYFLAEYSNQKITIQEEELLGYELVTYEEAIKMFKYESSKRILKEANDFLDNL